MIHALDANSSRAVDIFEGVHVLRRIRPPQPVRTSRELYAILDGGPRDAVETRIHSKPGKIGKRTAVITWFDGDAGHLYRALQVHGHVGVRDVGQPIVRRGVVRPLDGGQRVGTRHAPFAAVRIRPLSIRHVEERVRWRRGWRRRKGWRRKRRSGKTRRRGVCNVDECVKRGRTRVVLDDEPRHRGRTGSISTLAVVIVTSVRRS